jgi:hypothetical protein
VEAVCLLLLALCILASAVSLIWRYRHSTGEVRQQIKWLAFAASFVGIGYFGILVYGLFFADYFSAGGKTPIWLPLLQNAVLLGYAGVPTAIGFAVLKYRLYDIDIIINRALVYGPLTVLLVAVYFGGVVGTQTAFRVLTGQEQQPQLAVVVSTLAIAALFNPLRRRIQSFIDRRFYRRKYDAARILEAFSARLREETDLDRLGRELVSVVHETMRPEHASLWLKPAGGPGRKGSNGV